jgi:hypothetical protein
MYPWYLVFIINIFTLRSHGRKINSNWLIYQCNNIITNLRALLLPLSHSISYANTHLNIYTLYVTAVHVYGIY